MQAIAAAPVDVDQHVAEVPEAPRLEARAARDQRREDRAHLAPRGGLDVERQPRGERGAAEAQHDDRQREVADADPAGAHRDDLDVGAHARHSEQHAEQERHRQRVEQQHGAEHAQHREHVARGEARSEQLVERAAQVSQQQDRADHGQPEQRVERHFPRPT